MFQAFWIQTLLSIFQCMQRLRFTTSRDGEVNEEAEEGEGRQREGKQRMEEREALAWEKQEKGRGGV